MNLAQIISSLAALNPQIANEHLLNPEHRENLPDAVPKVDNRKVLPGDIFICIKGLSSDGHSFAGDAILRGAALLVVQDVADYRGPYIKVDDTRKAAALLAGLYYQEPSKSFTLIGITGTNGKTTSSLLIYEALRLLGMKSAWIGTLGYYIDGELHHTRHTTPDIFELNQILAQMRDSGVSHVVMEVSSHAIALDRIFGLCFDFCLFTNLSREHLDFHKTMDEYGEVKYSFLEHYAARAARVLINTIDAFGAKSYARLTEAGLPCSSVGMSGSDYSISQIELSPEGSSFLLAGDFGTLDLQSQLIGSFNVENLALAVSCLLSMNIRAEEIERIVPLLKPVKGRFQTVPNPKAISVFVDYAHSPDAIETILKSCNKLNPKRLLCLVGAGGDRDKGKRPLMLQAALHNSDCVIITDDNPRTENPEQIILDMLSGTDLWFPWWIIRDRKTAIETILRLANPGDVVVLCGKGHEDYQEIQGARQHFDDYQVAYDYLNSSVPVHRKANDELVLSLDRLLLKLLINPLHESSIGGYIPPREYRYLSTDSRSLKPGSCFFALKGESFDGHNYLPDVCSNSANLGIGEQASVCGDNAENYEQCFDTYKLLGDLARKYLMMFPAYRIALTGSTGKSSTKEYLASIMTQKGKTLWTADNENNLIGLVKTILRIEPEDQYAVFELGTNHFGEIARLAEISMPDSAMILNVGPSHLEYLIDEDGVYREKTELFQLPLQYRLYPADDPRFALWAEKGLSVGIGSEADFWINEVSTREDSSSFKLNNQSYNIPTSVMHNVLNSSFAIALASCLGLNPGQIQEGLDRAKGLKNRLETIKTKNGLLLGDCYNANPLSMQKAIEHWIALDPERPHRAILGDMLELGSQAAMYHQMIGAILSEIRFESLITVGELSALYKPENLSLNYQHYNTVEEVLASLNRQEYVEGSIVLVKASHGIHLEKLLTGLGEV
ncbi:MAG: UDP-N-acetylmuramoyl-L-alanyl-D-glutamate--2,6-diaminopimelate ligase [Candidatus Cloacimonadota bacterium]